MEENKRGGKRLGAGRKPLSKKKKSVFLYVEENKIWSFGNEEKMKEKLYDFIDGHNPKTTIQDLTVPTDEIKPFIQPETNYPINNQQLKSFEQYRIEKQECEIPELWLKLKKEILEAPNLTSKQKNALTNNSV